MIAVVGLAVDYPGASTPDEFWSMLVDGRSGLTRLTDAELDAAGVALPRRQHPGFVPVGGLIPEQLHFDPAAFGFPAAEASFLDPQLRRLLRCCHHALEHAGHAGGRDSGTMGIYAGAAHSTYLTAACGDRWQPDGLHALPLDALQAAIGGYVDFLTQHVAHRLDLRGPAVTVQAACATSLVAIHTAAQALLHEECDTALAGGASLVYPQGHGILRSPGGMESPSGVPLPFSQDADGMVYSQGVGVVVLRRLADALADGDTIHAVLRASAVGNDGAQRSTFAAPTVAGQVRVASEALAMAGIDAADVGYIEGHGTATALGDTIEVEALRQVYPRTDGTRVLGAVKGNLGHTNIAAGVASFAKAVLAQSHRMIPGTRTVGNPVPPLGRPDAPFHVSTSTTPWTSAPYAAVNAYAVGGTTVHAILGPAPEPAARRAVDTRHPTVMLLSAHSETSVNATALNLARHVARHRPDPRDVTTTLARGRFTRSYRIAAVATIGEAPAALLAATPVQAQASRPVVLTLPDELPHRELLDALRHDPVSHGLIAEAERYGVEVSQPEHARLVAAVACARKLRYLGVTVRLAPQSGWESAAHHLATHALNWEDALAGVYGPTPPAPPATAIQVVPSLPGTPAVGADVIWHLDPNHTRYAARTAALSCIAELWAHGADLDIDALTSGVARDGRRIPLPVTVFDDRPIAPPRPLHDGQVSYALTGSDAAAAAGAAPGTPASGSTPAGGGGAFLTPVPAVAASAVTSPAVMPTAGTEAVSGNGVAARAGAASAMAPSSGSSSAVAPSVIQASTPAAAVASTPPAAPHSAVTTPPVTTPSTAAIVTAAWRDALGVDDPAPSDDFFTAGGHSLMALRLVNAVSEQVGCEVTIVDLMAASTLGEFGRRVEEKVGVSTSPPAVTSPLASTAPLTPSSTPALSSAASTPAGGYRRTDGDPLPPMLDLSPSPALPQTPPLPFDLDDVALTLRTGTASDGPILHLFHPSGGDITCYADLAGALPGELTVIAYSDLYARDHRVPTGADPAELLRARQGTALPPDVPTLAATYLAAVRRRQPSGPYLLGGWSMGGDLAQEVSYQLQRQGEHVRWLLMIDATNPAVIDLLPGDTDVDRWAAAAVRYVGAIEDYRQVDLGLGTQAELERALLALPAAQREPWLSERLRAAGQLNPRESVAPRVDAVLRDLTALARHTPRPFTGTLPAGVTNGADSPHHTVVTMLRAERLASRNSGIRVGVDDLPAEVPWLGWDGAVPAPSELVQVDAHHYTIVQQPALAHVIDVVTSAYQELPVVGSAPVTARRDAPTGTSLADLTVTPRRDPDAPFPLLPLQQGYFVGQLDGFELGYPTAHMYLDATLTDAPAALSEQVDALRAALRALVEAQPMLRVRVGEDGTQRILPLADPAAVPEPIVHDLRDATEPAIADHLAGLRRRMMHDGPNPCHGAPFELHLTALPERRGILHVGMSLLVMDGWGTTLFFQQLAELLANPTTALQPLHVTYADVADTLAQVPSTVEYQRDLAWWTDTLTTLPHAPALPLVADPQDVAPQGMAHHDTVIPAEDWQRFRDGCRQAGVTPTAALLAAYAIALSRHSGQRRLLLNSLQAGRLPLHPDIERMIGGFATTLLLPVDLTPGESFRDHARACQVALAQSLAHSLVSGVDVTRAIARERGSSRPVAPAVFMSTLGVTDDLGDMGTLDVGPLGQLSMRDTHHDLRTPQVAVEFRVFEMASQVHCVLSYVAELFDPTLIEALHADIMDAVTRFDDPHLWTHTPVLGAHTDPPADAQLRLARYTRADAARTADNGPASFADVLAGVREAWASVGDLHTHDDQQDFFSAGGDSLMAVRLVTTLGRRYGVKLTVRDLLTSPSMTGMAHVVADALAQGTDARAHRDVSPVRPPASEPFARLG